mmetsp:Transcript_103168/g.315648  ORF Transcript_103168/g.315648 Transcript_103168/m.315648 type:complete len:218 (+) Transcript_103168:175-828(+)
MPQPLTKLRTKSYSTPPSKLDCAPLPCHQRRTPPSPPVRLSLAHGPHERKHFLSGDACVVVHIHVVVDPANVLDRILADQVLLDKHERDEVHLREVILALVEIIQPRRPDLHGTECSLLLHLEETGLHGVHAHGGAYYATDHPRYRNESAHLRQRREVTKAHGGQRHHGHVERRHPRFVLPNFAGVVFGAIWYSGPPIRARATLVVVEEDRAKRHMQ